VVNTTKNVTTQLTQSEIQTANLWQLTTDEFLRFKEIKIQNQGLVSSTLTPIEWLGIFSTTDERRNHYAKMLALRQIATTEAILKFEAAYSNAIEELAADKQRHAVRSGRLLLVTPLRCASAKCTDDLQKALASVQQGRTLDIYIQDKFNNRELNAWTTTHQVPPNQLESGKVKIRPARGRMLDVKPGIYEVN